VDRQRIYVTGLSMGGEATYRFALQQPEMFAAIAPLSAYLSSPLDMKRIKDVPVWAIHGADDTLVPLSVGRKPVDALIKAGGNIRFSVLANHDHDVWTDTYSDPQFYDWLLQHQRPPKDARATRP
jgi:predicted peptidase